jgi:hypothetical protein
MLLQVTCAIILSPRRLDVDAELQKQLDAALAAEDTEHVILTVAPHDVPPPPVADGMSVQVLVDHRRGSRPRIRLCDLRPHPVARQALGPQAGLPSGHQARRLHRSHLRHHGHPDMRGACDLMITLRSTLTTMELQHGYRSGGVSDRGLAKTAQAAGGRRTRAVESCTAVRL